MVVYFSRGGRTRTIAEAIAQELECESVGTKSGAPQVSEIDMLAVGSGNYGGKPHESIQNFIECLQPSKSSKAAVFATSASPEPKCILVMQKALESKGYHVVSSFKCRGQFLFFNRHHPNEDNLKNAKGFAGNLKTHLR